MNIPMMLPGQAPPPRKQTPAPAPADKEDSSARPNVKSLSAGLKIPTGLPSQQPKKASVEDPQLTSEATLEQRQKFLNSYRRPSIKAHRTTARIDFDQLINDPEVC